MIVRFIVVGVYLFILGWVVERQKIMELLKDLFFVLRVRDVAQKIWGQDCCQRRRRRGVMGS